MLVAYTENWEPEILPEFDFWKSVTDSGQKVLCIELRYVQLIMLWRCCCVGLGIPGVPTLRRSQCWGEGRSHWLGGDTTVFSVGLVISRRANLASVPVNVLIVYVFVNLYIYSWFFASSGRSTNLDHGCGTVCSIVCSIYSNESQARLSLLPHPLNNLQSSMDQIGIVLQAASTNK